MPSSSCGRYCRPEIKRHIGLANSDQLLTYSCHLEKKNSKTVAPCDEIMSKVLDHKQSPEQPKIYRTSAWLYCVSKYEILKMAILSTKHQTGLRNLRSSPIKANSSDSSSSDRHLSMLVITTTADLLGRHRIRQIDWIHTTDRRPSASHWTDMTRTRGNESVTQRAATTATQ